MKCFVTNEDFEVGAKFLGWGEKFMFRVKFVRLGLGENLSFGENYRFGQRFYVLVKNLGFGENFRLR